MKVSNPERAETMVCPRAACAKISAAGSANIATHCLFRRGPAMHRPASQRSVIIRTCLIVNLAPEICAKYWVEAGVPQPLFKTSVSGIARPNRAVPYDVTADGQRFLVLVQSGEGWQPPLTVTTNWLAKVKK